MTHQDVLRVTNPLKKKEEVGEPRMGDGEDQGKGENPKRNPRFRVKKMERVSGAKKRGLDL